MQKLLIATGNPGKEEMFRELLNGEGYDLVFLSDLDYEFENPIEDGHKVEDNAYIKAKFFCELTGLPTLGDDAGFEITELSGAPGVKARRWAGELPDSASDEDWLEFFLEKTKHTTDEKLEASFPFSRCLYLPNGEYFFQSDKIDIFVSKEPRRPYMKGLPVSSVCYFPDGRHQLDVALDDPIYKVRNKKQGLLELLKNI